MKPMIRSTLRSSASAAWALAGCLALPASNSWAHSPDETRITCDGDPPFVETGVGLDPSADRIFPALTGIDLVPGSNAPTNGTNPSESPELSNFVVRVFKRPFTMPTDLGDIKGRVVQKIKRGTDGGKCKSEVTVQVVSGPQICITEVRIQNFVHPVELPIVADYRDDPTLPGDIVSKKASRSPGDGSKFRFTLPAGICVGQSSRPLLLNTSIRRMDQIGTLYLLGPNGEVSDPVVTYAPF